MLSIRLYRQIQVSHPLFPYNFNKFKVMHFCLSGKIESRSHPATAGQNSEGIGITAIFWLLASDSHMDQGVETLTTIAFLPVIL